MGSIASLQICFICLKSSELPTLKIGKFSFKIGFLKKKDGFLASL